MNQKHRHEDGRKADENTAREGAQSPDTAKPEQAQEQGSAEGSPNRRDSGDTARRSAARKLAARVKKLARTKPARIAGRIVAGVVLIVAGAAGMAVYQGRQAA